MRPARSRLLTHVTGADGTTLAELVILTAIMATVLAGAAGIYEVSQRSYAKSSSLLAAQSGVRNGLDRMTTELRLIGAYYTGFAGAATAITNATPTSITFRGDVDGDTIVAGAETTATAMVAGGATTIPVNTNARQTSEAFNTYPDPARNDFVCITDGSLGEVRQLSVVAGTNLTLNAGVDNPYPAGSIVRSVETVTYALDAANRTLTRQVGGAAAEVVIDNVVAVTLTYRDAAGVATVDLTLIREIQVDLTTRGTDGSQRTMTTRIKPRNLPS